MNFKKGDRVLVEATCVHEKNQHGEVGISWPDERLGHFVGARAAAQVQHHPEIPVADLLEELNSIWVVVDNPRTGGTAVSAKKHAEQLRAAREAAQAPKYTEGQEVWVRGHLASPCHDHSGKRLYVTLEDVSGTWVSEDDICTEKP